MIRVVLWLAIIYLAWQAYRVLKHGVYFERDDQVKGKQENPNIDIDENDIQDADFKDIKQ
ncbi:MAG TPA: hypothetical protein VKA68_00205 [bacterium]|nr:hypothetical protein [bacterium]